MAADPSYELALFRRISRGDEPAFREIFEHYKRPFYAAALKMTRSHATAEEVVQDVFVNLWQHRASLDRVEQVSAYLFAMVYHEITRHFRQEALQRKLKQGVLERFPQEDESTEQLLNLRECESSIREAVESLPPQQQLIYRLSKQEGRSREEIADLLHISPHTVKNHLLRALKQIRTKLHYPLIILISLFL